ncbi:hypothetical protein D3C77_358600 [compost metagenome]
MSTRKAGPITDVLKIGDRFKKCENEVFNIISFISSAVYPAAMRAATIEPEEVPATR